MLTGTIIAWPGTTIPPGWLMCDGSLYLQSQYPALFAVIGNTYTLPGQPGNFQVPDLRGRVIGGANPPAYTLGQQNGAEQTTLAVANLPAHTHGVSYGVSAGTKTQYNINPTPGSVLQTSTDPTGSGTPFDTRQPTTYIFWIIKT